MPDVPSVCLASGQGQGLGVGSERFCRPRRPVVSAPQLCTSLPPGDFHPSPRGGGTTVNVPLFHFFLDHDFLKNFYNEAARNKPIAGGQVDIPSPGGEGKREGACCDLPCDLCPPPHQPCLVAPGSR